MIFIVTFLILFTLLFLVLTSLHYWFDLLSRKNTYTRLELLDPTVLIGFTVKKINPSGNALPALISLLISLTFTFFLIWIGGLVAPDRSDSPDFAGNELANYFFQSNLILLMIHLSWRYIRDLTADKKNSFTWKLSETENTFLAGTALSLSAAGLASWGVYHEMYFLEVFVNTLLGLGFLQYILLKTNSDFSENSENESGSDAGKAAGWAVHKDDEYENIVGLDDTDFSDDLDRIK